MVEAVGHDVLSRLISLRMALPLKVSSIQCHSFDWRGRSGRRSD